MKTRMDWILFGTVLALLCFGLVMVYSASAATVELRYARFHWPSYHFLQRQAVAALAALPIMILLARCDYRKMRSSQVAFGALSMVVTSLIAVYFLDPKNHRWIDLPGLPPLQPSELAKPALIVFLAWFISERRDWINNRHTLWPTAVVMAFLASGVLAADLGTAVVLMAVAVTVLLLAGLSRKHCLTGLAVGLVCVTAAIAWKPYRLFRVLEFYDPDYKILSKIDPGRKMLGYAKSGSRVSDPLYQAEQSVVAIGAGGATGVGPGKSRQKLLFLPEAHTDFIFSIAAEEFGLIGSGGLLLAFCVIFWRGARQYRLAQDDFGRYLAIGVTTAICFQAMLNISVALALVPTKGFTLPLVSYGGSSLLATMIMLGMLLSVSQRSVRPA